ncbi:MAG: NAD/FAD-utilizing enzyme, partial [Wenzhouxiangellaceae bacterium]|nr:NAD/FAD-utilizing enzyme [Wenzhouxiangellaceae bacterium]
MKLKRHFYVSDDLDDLERFEEELEELDIVTPQIHLLTLDDGNAAHHHNLHEVSSLMKTDVVHSTLVGAVVGLCAAALALVIAYLFGWTDSGAGWLPFIFLAIILLGFFTWQGGLWGIENPNTHFKDFEEALRKGKHIFFVDLEPGRGKIVRRLARKH